MYCNYVFAINRMIDLSFENTKPNTAMFHERFNGTKQQRFPFGLAEFKKNIMQ